jgi:hypothetical protein
MKDLLLPYRVCDARYHSSASSINGSDFQVLFATNERWEAIAAAKDAGCGAYVVCVDENSNESVIFVNKYRFDLSLQS